MADIEKVIKGLECHRIDDNHRINCTDCPYYVDDDNHIRCVNDLHDDAITLLKEQEKKEIKLHKKHVITLKRDDEFTTRKLYEAVCETLMDEGELVIVRIDDHEKVDFTFYVTHEDT